MNEPVDLTRGERGPSVYELVGETAYFERLATAFYRHVGAAPELLALYPEPENLAPAARRLALFLAQYWGGPTTYSEERGHPRLRMRHMPFRVDSAARDQWLRCFTAALDECPVAAPLRSAILEHATNAANFLVNTPE